MAKKKHSVEWMVAKIEGFYKGEDSIEGYARMNGIAETTFRRWLAAYHVHGVSAFIKEGNNHYSKEFKTLCVELVINGELSAEECAAKYGISSDTVLRKWISEYNANIELKDYDPKREVYMAEARRKTTIEERKEIVRYCIEHNRDYKGTASLYDVSYTQVYSWVRKYDADGENALIDKRGHHKTDDEVDELERLRRENNRLKRQLEEKDMLVTLLKKVRELEGM